MQSLPRQPVESAHLFPDELGQHSHPGSGKDGDHTFISCVCMRTTGLIHEHLLRVEIEFASVKIIFSLLEITNKKLALNPFSSRFMEGVCGENPMARNTPKLPCERCREKPGDHVSCMYCRDHGKPEPHRLCDTCFLKGCPVANP